MNTHVLKQGKMLPIMQLIKSEHIRREEATKQNKKFSLEIFLKNIIIINHNLIMNLKYQQRINNKSSRREREIGEKMKCTYKI